MLRRYALVKVHTHTATVVVKFFCLGGTAVVAVNCVRAYFTATPTSTNHHYHHTAVCGDLIRRRQHTRVWKYPYQLPFVRFDSLISLKGGRIGSDSMPVVWTYWLPINNILVDKPSFWILFNHDWAKWNLHPPILVYEYDEETALCIDCSKSTKTVVTFVTYCASWSIIIW